MSCNFGWFFPFQPEADRDFAMGDAGAYIFDCAASRNYDSAFLELGDIAPNRPDVTHQKFGQILLRKQSALFAGLVADSQ